MAGQTIVRRASLLMTIDAESHVVINDAFGDRHLRHVAVACRAVYPRPHMRRMVEPHM